ncbi:hypothetical protein SAY87_002504 [Trapa incisa]|uniref:Late embryogenesis abundant protein LEA-2 subgroup domain-containing protein n=1 Tax=Trapa incisa TaxID=236973 RepID=A0AAN7PZS7_9MYRT|nr:hypothetical protein SAY87_002504 [Trapa incisa]
MALLTGLSSPQNDTGHRGLLWLLKVLALLGLIVLSTWLASLPKKPTSTISALFVPVTCYSNSSSVAGGGNSNTTISYTLEVVNTNKNSGIYYNDIAVTISVGDDKLGENIIAAFYQGKGKKKKAHISMKADQKVMSNHAGEFSLVKAQLKVILVTRIRYKTWGKKSKHHDLKLQGEIPFGSDGEIRGKKKKIKLHHSNKKYRNRTIKLE